MKIGEINKLYRIFRWFEPTFSTLKRSPYLNRFSVKITVSFDDVRSRYVTLTVKRIELCKCAIQEPLSSFNHLLSNRFQSYLEMYLRLLLHTAITLAKGDMSSSNSNTLSSQYTWKALPKSPHVSRFRFFAGYQSSLYLNKCYLSQMFHKAALISKRLNTVSKVKCYCVFLFLELK